MLPDQTSEIEPQEMAQDACAVNRTVESAVTALSRFWSDCRLYPQGHPLVEGQLTATEETLAAALDECGEVTIKTVGGDLVYGEQRLFSGAAVPAAFIGALNRRGVGFITFERGVAASDLRGLCEVLSTDVGELEDAGGPEEALSAGRVRHIRVGELAVLRPGGSGVGSSRISLIELYHTAMDVAADALQSVTEDRPIDVQNIAAIIRRLVRRITENPSAAAGLTCLKSQDDYVFSHCVHTTMLSIALGEAIGLETGELRELGIAAMLHDVGKVLVPLEILRKPDSLTDDERETIERHPVDGAAILLDCLDLPATAPLVAFEHHLRYDMSGYPQVPDKQELCLFSMMVSLTHTYDALVTPRSYRPAMRPDKAVAEMGNMPEGSFEPRLADWFRQMLGVYPPGTCVELDSGECAVVCRSDPSDRLRPTVCVVMDGKGDLVSSPYEVDLSEKQPGATGPRRSIARALDPGDHGIEPVHILDTWLRLYCSAL